jgi:methylamine dehydrogenase accessory protein MauD
MITFLLVSNIALWITVLFLAFLLLGAVRVAGLLNWRVDELHAITPRSTGRAGLSPGTKAPDFTLPDVAGTNRPLLAYAGRKVLLVFTQAGCGPCHAIVPELNRLQRRGELQVVAVSNGDPAGARQWVAKTGATFPVLVQEQFDLSKRYRVFATPFAFLIDEKGIIASKGIVSNRRYIGYVLAAVRGAESEGHAGGATDGSEGGEPQGPVSISSAEASHV